PGPGYHLSDDAAAGVRGDRPRRGTAQYLVRSPAQATGPRLPGAPSGSGQPLVPRSGALPEVPRAVVPLSQWQPAGRAAPCRFLAQGAAGYRPTRAMHDLDIPTPGPEACGVPQPGGARLCVAEL